MREDIEARNDNPVVEQPIEEPEMNNDTTGAATEAVPMFVAEADDAEESFEDFVPVAPGFDPIVEPEEIVVDTTEESIPGVSEELDLVEDASEEETQPSNVVIRRVRSEQSDSGKESKRKEKGFLYSLIDTLRFISLGLVIGILLVIFVIQRNDVYGESMAPTLHDRDAVFVEMITTYTSAYERGDIVTINATGMEGYDKQEKLIKRVVGLPGETITIKDGAVYINGALYAESYLPEGLPTYVNEESIAKGYDEVVLGANQYYCLGDNRGASLDSRILGPFTADQIKAHVILKIFPFSDIKLFQ